LDNPEAEHQRTDALIQVADGFCLRTDNWAYMKYAGENGEEAAMLYDMTADPKQYKNLSGHPDYAVIEKRLEERLEARVAAAGGGTR